MLGCLHAQSQAITNPGLCQWRDKTDQVKIPPRKSPSLGLPDVESARYVHATNGEEPGSPVAKGAWVKARLRHTAPSAPIVCGTGHVGTGGVW